MKKKKAPGLDEISRDILEESVDEVKSQLVKLFLTK